MKSNSHIGVGVLGIWFAILLMAGCYEGAYVTQQVTTSGIVTVKNKNAAGKVTSVEIKTGSEPGFIVEDSEKGEELIGMIGKNVEVSGVLKGSAGTKQIKVESYKVID
jgi:hypothetical protein